MYCGGEDVRSRSEEIRQSNCNTYISVLRGFIVQLIISAPDEYIYERVSCVLFILATILCFAFIVPALNCPSAT